MGIELPPIVGLCGRKGSGKDTAAAVLVAKGYENIKFAGGLKTMLRALLAYQGYGVWEIDEMIEGELKETVTESLAGKDPRYAMQTLGSEWGRMLMGEDFWVATAISRMKSFDRVVVTDVRFPNEADAIRAEGGIIIGITADWIKPQEGEHESEAKIDEIIASLPERYRLINRRACPGEEAYAIQEFQSRFLHTISNP